MAATYPRDLGLEKDSSVVFAENFEGLDFRRWNNAEPPRAPQVQLVSEKTRVHSGKQAGQFTVPPGKGVGAGLVKWAQKGLKVGGGLTLADEKLFVMVDGGDLLGAEATPAGFKQLARAKALSGTCWTVPVVAHGWVPCRNQAGDLVGVVLR